MRTALTENEKEEQRFFFPGTTKEREKSDINQGRKTVVMKHLDEGRT